jgi:hypothetical protein
MASTPSLLRPVLVGVVLLLVCAGVLLVSRRDAEGVELAPGRHAFADGRVSLDLPLGGVDSTENLSKSADRPLLDRLFGPEPIYPGLRIVALADDTIVVSSTGPAERVRALLEHPLSNPGSVAAAHWAESSGPGEPEPVAIRGALEA